MCDTRTGRILSRANSSLVFLWTAMLLIAACSTTSAFADPVTWGSTIIVEPTQANIFGSWMRLLHLQDGSWLSASSIYGQGNNTYVNLRRSTDDLRTWTLLATLQETGRDMDNPGLIQLPNGNVLMTNRSTVGNTSHRIEIWTSTNVLQTNPFTMNTAFVDSFDNPNATNCPINSLPNSGHPLCGVWEPQLVVLPNGSVGVLYADESLQTAGTHGYAQAISEKISTDGGQTWGAKTEAVSLDDGASRPGMPYITHMENGLYMLSFEVCDVNNNCPGGYKTSADGVTWQQADLGNTLPTPGQSNTVVQSFSNGMLVMASGTHNSYWSGDYGANWNSMAPAFTGQSPEGPWGWQSLYQTRTNEVAQVNGPAIRLGTMAPIPYHDSFSSGNSNEFEAWGGSWAMSGGVMTDSTGGMGDKLVMVGGLQNGGIPGYGLHFRDYTVQADVRLIGTGNAGLLVRASSPGAGADAIYAWYVGVSNAGTVFLGDEHYGYTAVSGGTAQIPGGVPTNAWIHLTVTAANCTIRVTAQQVGSTSSAAFSYTDSTCSAHMGGTIGLRTYGTVAGWRNIVINETGPSPASIAPYLAPFANQSSSGWTAYGGTWSIPAGTETYQDAIAGQGDKSVVSASSASNLIAQSDVQMGTVSNSPNSGVLLGVSNPANGVDSLTGFQAGTGVQSVFLGHESNGWTGLTGTGYETALTAGQWVHVTVQTQSCFFLIAAQPLGQPYGYIQTYLAPGCTSTGAQGVREFSASTGFQNFSVLSN